MLSNPHLYLNTETSLNQENVIKSMAQVNNGENSIESDKLA